MKQAKHKPRREPSRVSSIEDLILDLLIGRGELYGLEMVKTSNGKLKRGTVYVTLQRMEEKGLVESREEDNPSEHVGVPRRLYKVTGIGQRAHHAQEMMRTIMAGGLVPKGA